MFDNSVTSLSKSIVSTFWESFKSINQYLDSFALFKAISWNFLNSNLELEAVASTRFAPILVPLLTSWSEIAQELLLLGSVSSRAIKFKLNL